MLGNPCGPYGVVSGVEVAGHPACELASRAAIAKPVKSVADGPILSTLSKRYIAEGKRGGTWQEVSTHEVERSLRDLFELMGDIPASESDVHQARLLKDRLSRCPQYFALLPQLKGKTLTQVTESGSTQALRPLAGELLLRFPARNSVA
jgi:hypothetical protein